MKRIEEYPVKILILLGEAISGNEKAHQWLVDNSYPELGAFVSAINSSDSAFNWLMKFKFINLAALCSAIYNVEVAKQWLDKFNYTIEFNLAEAVNNNNEAIKWFEEQDLLLFIILSHKIKMLKDQRYDDNNNYHKIQF